MKEVVILGAGGHAEVIAEIIERMNDLQVLGFIEKENKQDNLNCFNYPIIGTDKDLYRIYKKGFDSAIIGVGSTSSKNNKFRANLFKTILDFGFDPVNAIHPKSVLGNGVKLGKGITIMAGSIINTGASVNDNAVINTGSIIEHDCTIVIVCTFLLVQV